MSLSKSLSSFILSGVVACGTLGALSPASAADMAVKAPSLSPWVLDVHGSADFTITNTRVTGGGLLLYDHGLIYQNSVGLSLDIYKNPNGFINAVSVFGGVWD